MIALALATLALAAPAHWPTWGNKHLPDCTFAAAADWEWSHGFRPDSAEVIAEFHGVAGPAGLSMEQLASYWLSRGIGGVNATLSLVQGFSSSEWPIARGQLEAAITPDSIITVEGHVMLALGYGPPGIEVVSWGRVWWLPWTSTNVWGVYSVEAE